MESEEISFGTSFLDMLFITMFGFASLFILSFLLINPVKKDNVLETKAEFILTVEWPTNMTHDVDTWLQDPSGQHVCFNQREKGLMHLDRDDQGKKGDSYIDSNGNKIEYPYNREVTSIRGIFPGEYVANVHYYSVEYYETRGAQSGDRAVADSSTGEYPEPDIPDIPSAGSISNAYGYRTDRFEDSPEVEEDGTYPVEVTVRLDKVNPFSTVIEKKVILRKKGDEETAFRFTIGRDGRVLNTNNLKKNIARRGAEQIEEAHRRQQQRDGRRQQQILEEEFGGDS
jgi:hypothetical protein